LEIVRQFTGVAFTLALLAAAVWYLRTRGAAQWRPGRRSHVIEVVESRGIAPGHMLHLVRIGGRAMTLATHSSGCTLLEARPAAELNIEARS
jgi:flagellar biogenesis protein FliO